MNAPANPVEYLTLHEAADRMRCHYRTAKQRARLYLRTGTQGLECVQPGGPNTKVFVPADAVGRFMRGEKPVQRAPKLKRVG